MKRAISYLIAFLIIFGCFAFLTYAEAGSKNIPEYIENLVFKNPEFSGPIYIEIQNEDKPGGAERVKKMEEKEDEEYFACKRKGWGHICLPGIILPTSLNISKELLSFLVKHGYVRYEKVIVDRRRGSTKGRYEFLYYNERIKPYIVSKSSGKSNVIIIATRKLKSIDYTNQYKGTIPPVGAKTKFYALTFSYVLKEKLPGLPRVNKVFHGKAKAYLDPDVGQWKLWHDGIKLEDSGRYEYTKLIEQQYKESKLQN